MIKQKINCDVDACKHNDCKKCCCDLDEITVVSSYECPTAHFCQQYEEK